jgi:HEAT repeat protein
VRIKGLEALGNTELDAAMPIVRAMLQDPDPDVKYAATLSLIELAGDNCFQEISGMIGRTKGETLRQILRGFFHATNYLKIEIATAKAGDLLIDALETALFDDAPAVRKAAIWPLAWTKHERIAGILRRAYFQEADVEVKTHILRVVLSLNEEVGLPLLDDALASNQPELRNVAEKLKNDRAGIPAVKS